MSKLFQSVLICIILCQTIITPTLSYAEGLKILSTTLGPCPASHAGDAFSEGTPADARIHADEKLQILNRLGELGRSTGTTSRAEFERNVYAIQVQDILLHERKEILWNFLLSREYTYQYAWHTFHYDQKLMEEIKIFIKMLQKNSNAIGSDVIRNEMRKQGFTPPEGENDPLSLTFTFLSKVKERAEKALDTLAAQQPFIEASRGMLNAFVNGSRRVSVNNYAHIDPQEYTPGPAAVMQGTNRILTDGAKSTIDLNAAASTTATTPVTPTTPATTLPPVLPTTPDATLPTPVTPVDPAAPGTAVTPPAPPAVVPPTDIPTKPSTAPVPTKPTVKPANGSPMINIIDNAVNNSVPDLASQFSTPPDQSVGAGDVEPSPSDDQGGPGPVNLKVGPAPGIIFPPTITTPPAPGAVTDPTAVNTNPLTSTVGNLFGTSTTAENADINWIPDFGPDLPSFQLPSAEEIANVQKRAVETAKDILKEMNSANLLNHYFNYLHTPVEARTTPSTADVKALLKQYPTIELKVLRAALASEEIVWTDRIMPKKGGAAWIGKLLAKMPFLSPSQVAAIQRVFKVYASGLIDVAYASAAFGLIQSGMNPLWKAERLVELNVGTDNEMGATFKQFAPESLWTAMKSQAMVQRGQVVYNALLRFEKAAGDEKRSFFYGNSSKTYKYKVVLASSFTVAAGVIYAEWDNILKLLHLSQTSSDIGRNVAKVSLYEEVLALPAPTKMQEAEVYQDLDIFNAFIHKGIEMGLIAAPAKTSSVRK